MSRNFLRPSWYCIATVLRSRLLSSMSQEASKIFFKRSAALARNDSNVLPVRDVWAEHNQILSCVQNFRISFDISSHKAQGPNIALNSEWAGSFSKALDLDKLAHLRQAVIECSFYDVRALRVRACAVSTTIQFAGSQPPSLNQTRTRIWGLLSCGLHVLCWHELRNRGYASFSDVPIPVISVLQLAFASREYMTAYVSRVQP